MKVLQINAFYKYGSTGKIVKDLHKSYLNKGVESYALFVYGDNDNDRHIKKVSNKLLSKINAVYTYLSGYMYKGSLIGTYNIIKHIKKIKPDIIHIHCINGHMTNIYKLVDHLKKNKYPLVLTNHAEFFYTGSYTHIPEGSTQWLTGEKENYKDAKKLSNSIFFDKTHQSILKFKRIFSGYDKMLITSVSPWITERSNKSFVLKDFEHFTVLNGVDTSIFNYRTDRNINLSREKNQKYIMYVTSGYNHPLKGSHYFIEIAQKLQSENVKFIVVGLDKNEKLPENCINVGKIYDQQLLANYYSFADLTLLTSKMETFSMVVAESLCCGTPVVGFKAGGPESIAIHEFSNFVEYGDLDALFNEIMISLAQENKKTAISEKSCEKYRAENMTKSYIAVYNKLLGIPNKD